MAARALSRASTGQVRKDLSGIALECALPLGKPDMHDTTHCAGCGHAIGQPTQKFCPACGQPTPAHRIDWHFLGHELEHSVLHMDRGILFTLRSLMLRPGHFIRDYIEGRRTGHVRPLLLIMLMAAVVVFLSKLVLGGDVVGSAISAGFSDGVKTGSGAKTDVAAVVGLFEAAKEWTNRHYAMVTLILLPLEALAFRLAFRRFRELNYPEWLVIVTLLTAQTFLIQALFIPFARWWPHWQQWALAIALIYAIFSLIQYLNAYSRWKSALRAVLGIVLYQLMATILLTVVILAMVLAGMPHA